jgi:colicin import membrane protein
VTLLPGGEVLNVTLIRGSGNAAWDSAVERAIIKSQPLPLPDDPQLFSQFRELILPVRPYE